MVKHTQASLSAVRHKAYANDGCYTDKCNRLQEYVGEIGHLDVSLRR